MLKKVEEIGNENLEDEIYQGDEGEAVDGENVNDNRGNRPLDDVERLAEFNSLVAVNHNLRCEVEALKSKRMEILAAHEEEMADKDRLYRELVAIKEALDERDMKILKQKCVKERMEHISKKRKVLGQVTKDVNQGASSSTSLSIPGLENDVYLLSLIPPFLRFLPFGAKADYICSYLNQMHLNPKAQDVENFMKRYPKMFKQVSYGTNETLTENWVSILHLYSG